MRTVAGAARRQAGMLLLLGLPGAAVEPLALPALLAWQDQAGPATLQIAWLGQFGLKAAHCAGALIDGALVLTTLACAPAAHPATLARLRVLAPLAGGAVRGVQRVYAIPQTGLALLALSAPLAATALPLAAPAAAAPVWLALAASNASGVAYVALPAPRWQGNRLYYQRAVLPLPPDGSPVLSDRGHLIGIHAGSDEHGGYAERASSAAPFLHQDSVPPCSAQPGAKCVDWQRFFEVPVPAGLAPLRQSQADASTALRSAHPAAAPAQHGAKKKRAPAGTRFQAQTISVR